MTATRGEMLADEARLEALIERLARLLGDLMAATRAAGDAAPWALIGVRRRGDDLARRLAKLVEGELHAEVGVLDITLYRDDLAGRPEALEVGATDIPFDIDGIHVALIDDVVMSGRSTRAAINSLMDLGRPRRIWSVVLVDRPGRELPIAADLAALTLTQADVRADQKVEVHLRPTDPDDLIRIRPR